MPRSACIPDWKETEALCRKADTQKQPEHSGYYKSGTDASDYQHWVVSVRSPSRKLSLWQHQYSFHAGKLRLHRQINDLFYDILLIFQQFLDFS